MSPERAVHGDAATTKNISDSLNPDGKRRMQGTFARVLWLSEGNSDNRFARGRKHVHVHRNIQIVVAAVLLVVGAAACFFGARVPAFAMREARGIGCIAGRD